jgi:hypothetical protein
MNTTTRIFSVALTFALTGCGVHGGLRRDADTDHSFQYRMEVAGVETVRTASGSSNIGSVFCLIPIGSDPYKNAIEELHKNAKLQRNEVLVNFRDDIGFTGVMYLWCNSRLTVSADVVALTPAPPAAPATREIIVPMPSAPSPAPAIPVAPAPAAPTPAPAAPAPSTSAPVNASPAAGAIATP